MPAVSNTDYISQTDRQAYGNQPDNSTPTGTEATPLTPGGPPTGPAGGALAGTYPNPSLAAVGTAGNYERVTTNAAGQVSAGQNDRVNVKTYGALGNGVANDTAAIVAAKAVLTAGSELYFPSGTYLTDPIVFASLAGVTIRGDGRKVSIIKARVVGTGNCVNVQKTCSYFNIYDLTFDGSCTTRTAGQQAVIIDATGSKFCFNEIINSGEFAVMFGNQNTSGVSDCLVLGNLIGLNYADGINLQYVLNSVVANNIVDGADDDCIAVGYSSNGIADNVLVIGNFCRARHDLGTTTGRGILVLQSTNVTLEGNHIDTVKQHGIYVTTDDTGHRPTRTRIIGNTVRNSCINSGSGITVSYVTDCAILGNTVDDIDAGGGGADCINIADWDTLTVANNVLTQRRSQYCRGIHTDESAGFGATWTRLKLVGNVINLLDASNNESIYLTNSHVTMTDVYVGGTISNQASGGNYIYTDYLGAPAKVNNNTSQEGLAIANGGHGTAPTLANNN